MQINDFCQRFSREEGFRKSRLLFIPNEQDRTDVRSFFNNCTLIKKVRISDCITGNDFLPAPQKLFWDLRQRIEEANAKRLFAVVEGFDAIKKLWSAENINSAYANMRNLLDNVDLHFVILTNTYNEIAEMTFQHPRYKEGQIVLRIGENTSTDEAQRRIYLIASTLPFIPIAGVHRQSLQAFLRDCEDESLPDGNVNVSINSKGGELAGFSPDVEQIYSKERFLQVFCNLQHNLSDSAIDWLYAKVFEQNEPVNVLALAQKYFFPSGINSHNTIQEAPLKIRSAEAAEQEVLLWMLRLSLSQNSYLAYVLNNPDFIPEHFTSFYVCEALNHLKDAQAEKLSAERKNGLETIGFDLLSGEFATFIKQTKDFPVDQVAPWLNCQTLMEKHELVRRIAEMEAWEIPSCIFKSYPLLANYVKPYQLGFIELNSYFTEYRQQKLKNYVKEDFCEKAKNIDIEMKGITHRDSLLTTYACDKDTALLIVDALGAEYMPLLLALAAERSLGIETAAVAQAKLPTSTEFNSINWPAERRLPEVKALDYIIHNGAEYHMAKPVEENFVALLDVFETKILTEVAKAMTVFSRVILTSDHGATRLAVCAYQQGMAKTLTMPEISSLDDWRYTSAVKGKTPCPDLLENLSGDFWMVKGYNRFSKKGGKLHEMHGGATYEEILVPFIVFKQGAVFVPQAQQTQDTNVEFIENDDFDL